jgi:ABC-type glycerol-3-phosphate transport system substrate-binding protein
VATANLAAPFVHTAHAAGSLNVGFWDHWVPGGNAATEKLVREWAEKEKVDVKVDFITSQGNKLLLTIAAEGQARSGHDILAMPTWQPSRYAEMLEPVDDIVGDLLKSYGNVTTVIEYLGKINGHWAAVPATVGSQMKGPASRIDLMKQHAGIDIQALYPAGAAPNIDSWTMDAFVKAAEDCHKAGFPFGIGLGTTSDSVDTAGALFSSFGAVLVDEKENIIVKSDPVRQALEFCKRLTAVLPPDAPAWDDASNNKWLVSGKGAMIFNPPSAWAVAVRDAPDVAKQLWHHGMPKGPKGRYGPFLPFYWGTWSFSKNKSAAKSLLRHLSSEASARQMVEASKGYDIPAFAKLKTFPTWGEIEPPKGTLYHYPDPHGSQQLSIAAMPSPHRVAEQIYTQGLMTKMIVRHAQGEDVEKTIAWAESEIEGYLR